VNCDRLIFVAATFGNLKCFARFFLGKRRITTCGTVGAFRQIPLCTIEKRFGRVQVLGSKGFRTRFFGGRDSLPCIAHFLNRRAGATCEKQHTERNNEAAPKPAGCPAGFFSQIYCAHPGTLTSSNAYSQAIVGGLTADSLPDRVARR